MDMALGSLLSLQSRMFKAWLLAAPPDQQGVPEEGCVGAGQALPQLAQHDNTRGVA